MEPEDFLRSRGWRQYSSGYDKIGFSKDGYQLLHVLDAVDVEHTVYGFDYQAAQNNKQNELSYWKSVPEFLICLNCGSQDYKGYTSQFVYLYPTDTEKTNCVVQCDQCATIKRTVWRDANGDAIQYDDSRTGQYSYAIGEPLQGKKHFSEHLRKHDLVQKGTSRNTNDRRLKGH